MSTLSRLKLKHKAAQLYSFKIGDRGFCVPMSIALASGASYRQVREDVGMDIKLGKDSRKQPWLVNARLMQIWARYIGTWLPSPTIFAQAEWDFLGHAPPKQQIHELQEKGKYIVFTSVLDSFQVVQGRHAFYLHDGWAFGPRGERHAVPISEAKPTQGESHRVEHVMDMPQHLVVDRWKGLW